MAKGKGDGSLPSSLGDWLKLALGYVILRASFNTGHLQGIVIQGLLNYTYYTVAHKCKKWQLSVILASYENKHHPSERGRPLYACSKASSFSAANFPLGLVPPCS